MASRMMDSHLSSWIAVSGWPPSTFQEKSGKPCGIHVV